MEYLNNASAIIRNTFTAAATVSETGESTVMQKNWLTAKNFSGAQEAKVYAKKVRAIVPTLVAYKNAVEEKSGKRRATKAAVEAVQEYIDFVNVSYLNKELTAKAAEARAAREAAKAAREAAEAAAKAAKGKAENTPEAKAAAKAAKAAEAAEAHARKFPISTVIDKDIDDVVMRSARKAFDKTNLENAGTEVRFFEKATSEALQELAYQYLNGRRMKDAVIAVGTQKKLDRDAEEAKKAAAAERQKAEAAAAEKQRNAAKTAAAKSKGKPTKAEVMQDHAENHASAAANANSAADAEAHAAAAVNAALASGTAEALEAAAEAMEAAGAAAAAA